MKSDNKVQFYIAAEREVFGATTSVFTAMTNLVAAYFTFNIAYPKPLYSFLIFVQHYILKFKDEQTVPTCTTQLISALDKLQEQ